VLRSVTRRQGGRTVTIQKIEPPPVSTPPPAAPAPPALSEAEIAARIAEWRGKAPEFRMAILSATVFDHSRTFLRCWISGGSGNDEPREEFACWSNIDFNHFNGVGSVEIGGVRYGLITGVGNIDTERMRRLRAARGPGQPTGPDLSRCPPLPTDAPAFAPVVSPGGDWPAAPAPQTTPEIADLPPDRRPASAQAFVEGLHEIYAAEGGRLAAACQARQRAREEREAYRKAHPPKPKDITIRYSWRRK